MTTDNGMALVNATDGTLTARYEYGPFGEPLRSTGAMGPKNPVRFSTQYTDPHSAFLCGGEEAGWDRVVCEGARSRPQPGTARILHVSTIHHYGL